MNHYALLISPEARSAYFNDYQAVAEAELTTLLPNKAFALKHMGELSFIELELDQEELELAMRLSFVQGVFELRDGLLAPLDNSASFALHPDFVFGNKYKGKTNERLTQLLVNLARHYCATENFSGKSLKLLDPMCGRGTSLWWALRYGMDARGIELDTKALGELRQHAKKWTKLHRVKHKLGEGFIGKLNKKGEGKFLDLSFADNNMRVVNGRSQDAAELLKKDKFDMLISDLPYGVQHFSGDGTRNPLQAVEQSLDAWLGKLKPGASLVLAFNSNIPKRKALLEVLENAGLELQDFSAAHRMSESIVRDIVVGIKA